VNDNPNPFEVIGTGRFHKWVRKANVVSAVKALVGQLEANPALGDVIPKSGGIRKVRMAGAGRGKRGGFRVIYTILIESTLLVLLDGYSKSDKDDLTDDELADLLATAAGVERRVRAERAANTEAEEG